MSPRRSQPALLLPPAGAFRPAVVADGLPAAQRPGGSLWPEAPAAHRLPVHRNGRRAIKGDLRILEILQTKDEQANMNLGDPASFLNVFDPDKEADKVADFMADGTSPEQFEATIDAAKPPSSQTLPGTTKATGCSSCSASRAEGDDGQQRQAQHRFHPSTAYHCSARRTQRRLRLRQDRACSSFRYQTPIASVHARRRQPDHHADRPARPAGAPARQLPREVRDDNHRYALCAEQSAWPRPSKQARQAKAGEDSWPSAALPLAAAPHHGMVGGPRAHRLWPSPRPGASMPAAGRWRTGLHAHEPDTQPQRPAAADRVAGGGIQRQAPGRLQPFPDFVARTGLKAGCLPNRSQGIDTGRRLQAQSARRSGRHAAHMVQLAGQLCRRHDRAPGGHPGRPGAPARQAVRAARAAPGANQQAEQFKKTKREQRSQHIRQSSTNTASGCKTPSPPSPSPASRCWPPPCAETEHQTREPIMSVAQTVQTFAGIANENEFYSHHYLAEVFKGDIRARIESWEAVEEAAAQPLPQDCHRRGTRRCKSATQAPWWSWRQMVCRRWPVTASLHDDAERWQAICNCRPACCKRWATSSRPQQIELQAGMPVPVWAAFWRSASGTPTAHRSRLPARARRRRPARPPAHRRPLRRPGSAAAFKQARPGWTSSPKPCSAPISPPRYVILVGFENGCCSTATSGPTTARCASTGPKSSTARTPTPSSRQPPCCTTTAWPPTRAPACSRPGRKRPQARLRRQRRPQVRPARSHRAARQRSRPTAPRAGQGQQEGLLHRQGRARRRRPQPGMPAPGLPPAVHVLHRGTARAGLCAHPEERDLPQGLQPRIPARPGADRPQHPDARDGFYFDATLRRLFTLVAKGCGAASQQSVLAGSVKEAFALAPLDSHLFDPTATPLLDKVRFPNHVWQRVIRLMSLSRGKGAKGRVSYQLLSINQLGAVYEALLRYRGFFAAEDLYEVQPAAKKSQCLPATPDDDDDDEGECRTSAPGARTDAAWTAPGSCLPAASTSTSQANEFMTLTSRATASCACIRAAASSTAWPGATGRRAPATTPRRCSPGAWSNTRSRNCSRTRRPTTS